MGLYGFRIAEGHVSAVKRILVVGGGIGGLSAAIALRQAGFEVDVVEKSPAWDVYGVGIIQPATRCGPCTRSASPVRRSRRAPRSTAAGCTRWPGETMVVRERQPASGRRGSTVRKRDHSPQVAQDPPAATLDSGADVRTGVTLTD